VFGFQINFSRHCLQCNKNFLHCGPCEKILVIHRRPTDGKISVQDSVSRHFEERELVEYKCGCKPGKDLEANQFRQFIGLDSSQIPDILVLALSPFWCKTTHKKEKVFNIYEKIVIPLEVSPILIIPIASHGNVLEDQEEYALFGMCVHRGKNAGSGHYVAVGSGNFCTKHQPGGKCWMSFDDANASSLKTMSDAIQAEQLHQNVCAAHSFSLTYCYELY